MVAPYGGNYPISESLSISPPVGIISDIAYPHITDIAYAFNAKPVRVVEAGSTLKTRHATSNLKIRAQTAKTLDPRGFHGLASKVGTELPTSNWFLPFERARDRANARRALKKLACRDFNDLKPLSGVLKPF